MNKENELTFESALLSLEETIRELEKGEVPLDDMVKKYQSAMEMVNFCETKLNEATKTVNKILNEDGTLSQFKTEE